MITIKTIENPEYKNCCEIPSSCGRAYVIKQNAKHINDEKSPLASRRSRRDASTNSEREIRDEFEEMIAITLQMYNESLFDE